MMNRFNQVVNNYFGIIMLVGALSGLFLPSFNSNNSLIIILALGSVIFISFFRIDLNRELLVKDMKYLPAYYLLRFLVLPIVVYFGLKSISDFYATAFFLLLMLPAAVSSPAFTALFNGDVSLSLKILVFSSFAGILIIPVLSQFILSRNIQIDSQHMFMIMVYTIVVPFLLHMPVRRFKRVRGAFVDNSAFLTAIGLIVIVFVSTSKNKAIILADPRKMLLYAGISIILYLLLYLLGFYLTSSQQHKRQISYSVSSGANNIGIGVTLTMLFFPGEMNVFFIVSQISWVFVLIPMRLFYRKVKP